MDVKFLLAALVAVVSPPAAAAASAEVSFPDLDMMVGISRAGDVEVRTAQPDPDAQVEIRLDATDIASFASVTTETQGCLTKANVITCSRKMETGPDGAGVAQVFVTDRGKAGTGQITVTASVNGVSTTPFHSTVTVADSPKVIPVGAKVKAPGQTKVKLKVGTKNVGKAPATFPPSTPPNLHSLTHYISLPPGTYAESLTGGPCFGWGPGPDGWEWRHPNEPNVRYGCVGGPAEPGTTDWHEMVVVIDPQQPYTTGEISLRDLITGEERTASIVIDTRKDKETLPVTGPRVRDIAIAAIALIVPGVLLLVLSFRSRQARRAVK